MSRIAANGRQLSRLPGRRPRPYSGSAGRPRRPSAASSAGDGRHRGWLGRAIGAGPVCLVGLCTVVRRPDGTVAVGAAGTAGGSAAPVRVGAGWAFAASSPLHVRRSRPARRRGLSGRCPRPRAARAGHPRDRRSPAGCTRGRRPAIRPNRRRTRGRASGAASSNWNRASRSGSSDLRLIGRAT